MRGGGLEWGGAGFLITGYRKSSPGPTPFKAVVRFSNPLTVHVRSHQAVVAWNRIPLVDSASFAKQTTQVCEGMRRVTIYGTPL